MSKEFICIVCPNSCRITVQSEQKGNLNIQGAQCKKGEEFVENEIKNPLRIFTGSIRCKNGDYELVSVKTSKPVPKRLMQEIAQQIKSSEVKAPVEIGQVLVANIFDLKVDLVATRKVKLIKQK